MFLKVASERDSVVAYLATTSLFPTCVSRAIRLSKIIHASFEEGLDFFSGDVLGDVVAAAFCVAHFS